MIISKIDDSNTKYAFIKEIIFPCFDHLLQIKDCQILCHLKSYSRKILEHVGETMGNTFKKLYGCFDSHRMIIPAFDIFLVS